MIYKNPKQYDKPIKLCTDKTLGYVYFFDRQHPLANSQGKVYYHRHVASIKRGKWIDHTYHVHHKDGVRNNNDPLNIEIVSPRMHSRVHARQNGHTKTKVRNCITCKKKYVSSHEFCSRKCSNESSRKLEVSKEDLERLVWTMPTTKIAEIFKVSDTAISKRCKLLSIEKPPRGYWAKYKLSHLK